MRRVWASLAFLVLVSVCHAADPPDSEVMPRIALRLFASGLREPTHITHAGDGRLFVTERAGRIMIIKDGRLQSKPFLDIRDRVESGFVEQGLLSAAFPPGYSDKSWFYVNYSAKGSGDTVVARYRTASHATQSSSPDIADAASEEIIIRIGQPYVNHNGGQIAFGPDGYLYIGMGDGGSGGDPHGNARSPKTLLGKLLRIDTESGDKAYSVPQTNPFVNTPGYLPEIWAFGFRNPWRFSFDRATRDLYIADVGQSKYEEVDFQPAASRGGENYGWSFMEGAHCYKEPCDKEVTDPGGKKGQSGLEAPSGVAPVAEYSHRSGCSVTGGFVYRGKQFPSLYGVYIYGDYCSGRIWGLRKGPGSRTPAVKGSRTPAVKGSRTPSTIWENTQLMNSALAISTFGEDADGELYVADFSSGNIYRIIAKGLRTP